MVDDLVFVLHATVGIFSSSALRRKRNVRKYQDKLPKLNEFIRPVLRRISSNVKSSTRVVLVLQTFHYIFFLLSPSIFLIVRRLLLYSIFHDCNCIPYQDQIDFRLLLSMESLHDTPNNISPISKSHSLSYLSLKTSNGGTSQIL